MPSIRKAAEMKDRPARADHGRRSEAGDEQHPQFLLPSRVNSYRRSQGCLYRVPSSWPDACQGDSTSARLSMLSLQYLTSVTILRGGAEPVGDASEVATKKSKRSMLSPR